MSLFEKAKAHIEPFWHPTDDRDKMRKLEVRHDRINGVDVFFWGPRGLFELEGEEAFPYLLGGNSPVLYDAHKNLFIFTGTACPIEEYVANYLRFGDPHLRPGPSLVIDGWERGANAIKAILAIRSATRLGLAKAKSFVDAVCNGESVEVQCADPETSARLVTVLTGLGFKAMQKGR